MEEEGIIFRCNANVGVNVGINDLLREYHAIILAGGSTIPAQVAKTIIAFIDFHMQPKDAIALGMIYAPGDTVLVERGTSLEAMIPQLQALGHGEVRLLPPGTFKANAIGRVDGRWMGGADPRSEGAAVSE